jgi:SET domain-containing protein
MDPSEYNLEKRPSNVHGFGMFTLKNIKKGAEICPFAGEEMSYQEFKKRYGNDLRGVYRRMYWQDWIVCKVRRNIVSFVNDGVYKRVNPKKNCVLKKGSLYAIDDIPANAELLLSYGNRYWANFDKLTK